MKLTLLQENLKNAVSLTSHFTSPKAQLPILGNILLKAEKSKLYLSSTNLEISVRTSIAAKIEEEGEITINGKTLNDIVSNLNNESIEIESVQENFRITSGKFKSNLLGSNTADFPNLPTQTGKNNFKLNKEDLINALSKVLFSVSTDETRPILTGVLFLFSNKTLKLVSTDGFRLSEVKLKGEVDANDLKIIIPKTVLYELTKIAVDSDTIEVSFDNETNQVLFVIDDTTLSSRVIEGEFPDYEKIIPQASIATIFVDKREFEKAIKLASVFARESGKIVRFKVFENKMTVSAESSSSGNQEMELEIRNIDDSPIQNEINIMFNFSFIEDILKAVIDDEVKIIFAADNKASKFIDSKSSNYLHIIMPIKTT
jgi:DNA polymerase-3 subunit beta